MDFGSHVVEDLPQQYFAMNSTPGTSPASSGSDNTLDRVAEQSVTFTPEECGFVNELRGIYTAIRQHRLFVGRHTNANGGREGQHVTVAELQLGELYLLSTTLGTLSTRVGSLDSDGTSLMISNGAGAHQSPLRPLVLSCYASLEQIYRATLEVLAQIQAGPNDFPYTASNRPATMVIDGFSTDAGRMNQVRLVLQLSGQSLEMVRRALGLPGQETVER